MRSTILAAITDMSQADAPDGKPGIVAAWSVGRR